MPRSYPLICTHVLGNSDASSRAVADLRSVSDSTASIMIESFGRLRSVRIDVGDGIRPESLGKLAMVARRVRAAERVELVGANVAAVDDAKALLLLLWTTG